MWRLPVLFICAWHVKEEEIMREKSKFWLHWCNPENSFSIKKKKLQRITDIEPIPCSFLISARCSQTCEECCKKPARDMQGSLLGLTLILPLLTTVEADRKDELVLMEFSLWGWWEGTRPFVLFYKCNAFFC